MQFTKMHGLGNDYVYVNCFAEKIKDAARLSQLVSDRHRGIGADGLILIHPSEKADVRMQMFNADGSEAEMCGNGIRCVAKYSYEHDLAKATKAFSIAGQENPSLLSINVETKRGILAVGLKISDKNKVEQICVNMGTPLLAAEQIPVKLKGDSVIDKPIDIAGLELQFTAVSMGNPHAVFFCEDAKAIDLVTLGPIIENHPLFPKKINAHFVSIISEREFDMVTWERGSGITQACGTGACACCVAAVLATKCQRNCLAHLPGGDLELLWSEDDNCVYMTGPATEVFQGTWPE
jgi:diaminopimelate epimerase